MSQTVLGYPSPPPHHLHNDHSFLSISASEIGPKGTSARSLRSESLDRPLNFAVIDLHKPPILWKMLPRLNYLHKLKLTNLTSSFVFPFPIIRAHISTKAYGKKSSRWPFPNETTPPTCELNVLKSPREAGSQTDSWGGHWVRWLGVIRLVGWGYK